MHYAFARQRGSLSALPLSAAVRGSAPCALCGPGGARCDALRFCLAARLIERVATISGHARQRALRPLRAGRRLVRRTTLSLGIAAHRALCYYKRLCAAARPVPFTGRAALGAMHHAFAGHRGSSSALLLKAAVRGSAHCALYGPGGAWCSAPRFRWATRLAAHPVPYTGRAALGVTHHAFAGQRGSSSALLLKAAVRGSAPCALYGPGGAWCGAPRFGWATRLIERVATTSGCAR